MKTSMQRTNFRDLGMNGRIAVVRVELKQGTFTRRHRHESECVVMVLEGTMRFHLPNKVVTLSANEMLRLAAGDEHVSEALADTIALNISTAGECNSACGTFLHYDPDQYLWGV